MSSSFFKLRDALIVLAVIGILGAIIIPAITVIDTPTGYAPKSSAMNNLGQIAKSNLLYSFSGNNTRALTVQSGDTAHEAAYILARDVQFNDAVVWFIKSDPRLEGKTPPKTVLLGDPSKGVPNPEFAKLPLSVVFVANLPSNAPHTTTPIAWTRDLQSDGTWAHDSPWKGEGGHIAYLDGHVEWYDKVTLKTDNQSGYFNGLVKYGTTIPTTNIREALPPGAVILSAEPKPLASKPPATGN